MAAFAKTLAAAMIGPAAAWAPRIAAMTMPEPQDKITTPSQPLEATMNKRLIAAAAATALGASAAGAEPPTIPPEFWGEWCTPQPDPDDANKRWSTLPSQQLDGVCYNIVAISREGLTFRV